jgi:hypothetical protein
LQCSNIKGLGCFLTTQYINNPYPTSSGYYDYYYSGSADGGSNYYFLEDCNGCNGNTGNTIYGQNGGSNYFPFMPPDQQSNLAYSQYGLFWLYNWFQVENNAENNNMNIYFLMNGNIFNYSLVSEQPQYSINGGYAIPPAPPANTINGEPIFAQSYINAYNTAFNQQNQNYQKALNNYRRFASGDVNNNFINGTFGSLEEYNSLSNSVIISYLQDDANYYDGTPYLFISAGSGGGSGYMYLDWVIVTYGVPYVTSVS